MGYFVFYYSILIDIKILNYFIFNILKFNILKLMLITFSYKEEICDHHLTAALNKI